MTEGGTDTTIEEAIAAMEAELLAETEKRPGGRPGNPGIRAMNDGPALLSAQMREATKRGAVALLVGERKKGESKNAILACNDFMRLGPGRNIPKLRLAYVAQVAVDPSYCPPSLSKVTMTQWSGKHDWTERAAMYDKQVDDEKTERAEQLITTGLALVEERLAKLYALSEMLEEELYARADDGTLSNLWLKDVKQIGSGKNAERVDIRRFNPAIVSQFRDALADIAAEMGHRVRGVDITSKGKQIGGKLTDDERRAEISKLLESKGASEA
jgi:hypothetical protein